LPETKVTNRRIIVEFVGLMGVVGSLLLVAYELRQNTAAVRGATYQSLADASTARLFEDARDPSFSTLLARVFYDRGVLADFTAPERMQLWLYHAGLVRQLENVWLQYESGVVGEEVFDSYGWSDSNLRTPYFQEFWFDAGGDAVVVSETFGTFLESRLGITP
jgi:hypothetical protein